MRNKFICEYSIFCKRACWFGIPHPHDHEHEEQIVTCPSKRLGFERNPMCIRCGVEAENVKDK